MTPSPGYGAPTGPQEANPKMGANVVAHSDWRRFVSAQLLGAVILAGGVLLAARPVAAQADLALVLAVDVSSSVNEDRFKLQREGIAEGLESENGLAAIAGGPHQTIELAIM